MPGSGFVSTLSTWNDGACPATSSSARFWSPSVRNEAFRM
jgi:hypothetical protein